MKTHNVQDREATLPPFVVALAGDLGLESDREYDLAALRVSARGRLDKLEDQEDTGIAVYADNPDFGALARLPADPQQRGWLEIRYTNLGGKRNSVFAWVGLVGRTVFVAAADSAVEANLPPGPDDVAGIGRNAYVELFIAAARACHARNIWLPFLSRIWRDDLWAEMLLKVVNRHLPGCTVWEGREKLATYGDQKLVTSVKGRQNAGYGEKVAEQTFEKEVTHLHAGKWGRRECELPLGLQRDRVTLPDKTVRKGMKIEESPWRSAAEEALRSRAAGRPWAEIGARFAELKVPMPGARGSGRTFADYRDNYGRNRGAETLILQHLDYYRTGEFTARRSTKLPADTVRGHKTEHDPITGRRYIDVQVEGLPWRPFLTAEQWEAFDRHEARARAAATARKTGAATHGADEDDVVSAFRAVPEWHEHDTVNVIAAETPTAYRWRTDGTVTATLRRTLVHHGCGHALLEGLRGIDRPLAPSRRRADEPDPRRALADRLRRLDAEIEAAQRASDRADTELDAATADTDRDEIDHWRHRGRAARQRLRELRGERARAVAAGEDAEPAAAETVKAEAADITEAVLLASLLLDGPKRVPPLVAELCDEYGITGTLHAARNDDRSVRLTATARIPLLDGSSVELPLVWAVPDSHRRAGDIALLPTMVRRYAEGYSVDAIAERFPDHDAARVRKRLRDAFRRAGITDRGLRSVAIRHPFPAVRATIASIVLDEPSLASPYSAEMAEQVENAYFGEAARFRESVADTANLAEFRRVLEVLRSGDPDEAGIDIGALARNATVARRHVLTMLAARLLDKASPTAARLRRCPECATALSVLLPAPETGSGLICPRCWRAEGLPAILGEEYLQPWQGGADGTYTVAARPAVAPARRARDRMLSVAEVAQRFGIKACAVRELDREGELVPDSRSGINGGRLYSLGLIDGLPPDDVTRWRKRFAPPDDGLLGTKDVAAALGCTAAVVRDLVTVGLVPVAATTDGGHRRFRREDIDRLDRSGVAAYRYESIGPAAQAMGLSTETLARLARTGRVPSIKTVGGSLRFDLDALRDSLADSGLLGSPDNPIVAIGDIASHPQVQRPLSEIRTLIDSGVIPVAGWMGGKRRFRLADALAALDTADAGPAKPGGSA